MFKITELKPNQAPNRPQKHHLKIILNKIKKST